MHSTRREFIATAGAATLLAASPRAAMAQAKLDTVKIFVGFTPGTTPDVLARKVADKLTRSYAHSALVENRLGAGGQLAVTATKAAPGDGSGVLLTAMSILGVYPYTYKKLPYDAVTDLAPVSMGATFDYGIGVGPAVPESVKDVRDLMAWYRANPGNMSIGSPATGSTLHFTGVMLGKAAGLNLTHVGYKGSGPAIQDMLGGTLPALCTPLGTLLNQPKLRVLGTSGARRSPFTPQAPTLVEQGFKDMVFSEWYGFYLPANASAATVARLNAALREALAAQDVIETLTTFGMEAAPSSPEQLKTALREAQALWAPIVKETGFTADS
ncbi:MAG: twin-arginine translocation pathway signal protein [Variovorax paradoxus]|uniref:Twin-arginine translocation pathway signal protein n=1 Tax=Variovorax paradoxus TaxID=34073 RepID=A0A2W5Q6T4_VARPD|nr:MAG: twin-arginine translocation pathway signal protein [Variovorax paradoxus]